MSDIEVKRFGRPIIKEEPERKILEFVADLYSKNFKGKTIPLEKLNIIEELPNFNVGTLTYYIGSIVNEFDYKDIIAIVEVNKYYDIIDYKMYENVVNPSNICKTFLDSFDEYDGGDW